MNVIYCHSKNGPEFEGFSEKSLYVLQNVCVGFGVLQLPPAHKHLCLGQLETLKGLSLRVNGACTDCQPVHGVFPAFALRLDPAEGTKVQHYLKNHWPPL